MKLETKEKHLQEILNEIDASSEVALLRIVAKLLLVLVTKKKLK